MSIANARGRGRGRGGGRSERGGKDSKPANKQPRNAVVSSSGLFSEGAGDGVSTKRLFRSFRGANDDATASTLRRPTLSSKREKIDPHVEQKQISEIYDLDADETDDVSSFPTNDFFSPVNINQGDSSISVHSIHIPTMQLFDVSLIKNIFVDFTVKSEVKLEERINAIEIKEENSEHFITRLKYPNSIDEFIDRNTPQLFLMQVCKH